MRTGVSARRQWRFVEIGKLVDPGDRGTTVGDVRGALDADPFDAFGDVLDRTAESAAGFDVLEVRPGVLSEGLGEVLDVPRAPGGVEHPADARLLQ